MNVSQVASASRQAASAAHIRRIQLIQQQAKKNAEKRQAAGLP